MGVAPTSTGLQPAARNSRSSPWRKVKDSNPQGWLPGLVFKTSSAPMRATFQVLARFINRTACHSLSYPMTVLPRRPLFVRQALSY